MHNFILVVVLIIFLICAFDDHMIFFSFLSLLLHSCFSSSQLLSPKIPFCALGFGYQKEFTRNHRKIQKIGENKKVALIFFMHIFLLILILAISNFFCFKNFFSNLFIKNFCIFLFSKKALLFFLFFAFFRRKKLIKRFFTVFKIGFFKGEHSTPTSAMKKRSTRRFGTRKPKSKKQKLEMVKLREISMVLGGAQYFRKKINDCPECKVSFLLLFWKLKKKCGRKRSFFFVVGQIFFRLEK